MGTILQEIRLGLRQMRKAPAFTVVAVLTLALGIGANTAVFTLLDQALLRDLPVSHPEQLVRLRFTGSNPGHIHSFGGDSQDYFSFPLYQDLRDKNTVFDGLIASTQCQLGVQWKNRSDLADCELVSGNYFQVLGVRPALGRTIVPSDEVANSSPIVVLSFKYWATHFAADPSILNQTLLINGHPFAIAGVAAPEFRSVVTGQTPQIFAPISTETFVTPRYQELEDRKSHWLTLVARLKPRETREHAEAGMNPLWHSLRAEELAAFNNSTPRFRKAFLDDSRMQLFDGSRGFSPVRDQVGTPLLIAMAMVGLVMLMACVNVSSLLLVRAAGRVKEMSVRYALGATRWQITQQLLIEGLLLGTAGGTAGVVIAPTMTKAIVHLVMVDQNAQLPFSTQPDLRILLFNFSVAFFVSVLFGLAPALRFLRPDLVNSLKQQTTTATSPLRFRRLAVGFQIGLSLLLLIGAGLFVRTLRNLSFEKVGFATDDLLTFGINPELAGYRQDQVASLHQQVLLKLAALPGVRAVGATDDPELADDTEGSNFSIAGYDAKEEEDMHMEAPWVMGSYFESLQIPLIAGRTIGDQDVPGKPTVAVVNEKFARRYFGEPRNAIGHFLADGAGPTAKYDIEIVGVVGDAKHANVRDDIRRTVYRSFLQDTKRAYLQYYLRTWQSPEVAEANVRTLMQQIDSKLVIDTMRTMHEQIADSLMTDRLVALLAGGFALLATILAAIGLYGVLAYSTEQRTREIGIRMALGAQRLSVVRMVLLDVLWLAGVSISLTIPLALLGARIIRSQLYGVSGYDPLTLLAGTLMVALVALLAALLPARRAASIEPMNALRTE
jgi:putative ABC transport system permease protein